ncbi:MAG: aminoacyl-histidine dipeptidase [Desulfobacterales bacterium]|jgi:dipeptidase D
MNNLKSRWFVFFAFSIFLSFAGVFIPTTLLASGAISIESAKVSAVIEKFEQISSIPRCPGEEKNIAKMLKRWSEANDLKFKKDGKGNVLVKVPATKGFENAPTIILQAHLDMVCEKTPDSNHNFKKDALKLKYDGKWLSAQGTTLGADNGIGIALCMASVEDENVSHPPLELLFTVEEEIGLKGAAKLKSGFIKGKIFINVDSEGEGVLTIGSAGGSVTLITLPTTKKKLPPEFKVFNLQVSGLRGGHSGLDINKGRGNSIKIIAAILDELNKAYQIRLVTLKAGSKANAIPQNALASLAFESGFAQKFKEITAIYEQNIQKEFASTESNVSITLTAADEKKTAKAITPKDTQKIINLLKTLPDGVAAMSSEFEGNVEISNNIGLAHFKKNTFVVISLERSATIKEIDGLQSRIQSAAKESGAKAKVVDRWPAWEPNSDSALLQQSKQVYRATFGKDSKIEVVHGGLECSIIAAKIPEMDMIAIGPAIENSHTPNEPLPIPSVEKLWKFLTALLASYGS